MNTAIYARSMSVVGKCSRMQIKMCKKVAREKNLLGPSYCPNYCVYKDGDTIRNGSSGFKGLMRGCHIGMIKTVIVDDLTTLCGSIVQLHHILGELADYGVRIISINDGIDWKPSESRELVNQWMHFIASSEDGMRFYLKPTLTEERLRFQNRGTTKIPAKSLDFWKKIDPLQEALDEAVVGLSWNALS